MNARLTSAMLASALIRRAHQAGGSATVIAKGEEERGAILIQMLDRGRATGIRERLLDPRGHYRWTRVGPDDPHESAAWLEKRRRVDPDLWIIELDIADVERFADEILLMH